MNPPYAFNGSRGGGGMAYMAMVNIRDSIQGIVKIWNTKHTAINWQGLAKT